jgi:phosphoadenosine phosphosulfate reductase
MPLAEVQSEKRRSETVDRIEDAANRLEDAPPEEILAWAYDEFPGTRIAIATGFGVEGMALIDIATRVNPEPRVFFIDTDFLFPETYALRRRVEDRYGIQINASRSTVTVEQQETLYGGSLWERDPDLCCQIRKLEPLKEALQDLDAWITAIRRDQTPDRAAAEVVEWDTRWQLVKINPLANWSRQDVWRHIFRNNVPYNTLHDQGYPSIGCLHCTRAVAIGEGERAGRWAGRAKTECGLHGGPQPLVLLAQGAR